MIDAYRLLDATTVTNNKIDTHAIITDRFRGLLHDQPEKLERVLKALEDPELLSTKGKSLAMQIFMMNYILAKLLYKYSGRTGIHIGTVRIALVDTDDMKSWLNLLDLGVFPMFATHDVV